MSISFIGNPNKQIRFIVFNHLFHRSNFSNEFTVEELLSELKAYGLEDNEDTKQEVLKTIDDYIALGSISIGVGVYRFNMIA